MKLKGTVFSLSIVILVSIFVTTCQSPEVTSAKVYFQQNNIDAAEEQLLIALEKEPLNPEVPFLLATEVYAPRRNWDKVIEMLNKAAELSPEYSDRASAHKKNYWGELYNRAARIFNQSSRALFPMEKDSLLRSAADKFLESITMKPDESSSYNGLIKCYYQLGDSAKVEEYAKMALKNSIYDQDVIYFYSKVLWKSNRQDEALSMLKKYTDQYTDATDLQLTRIEYLLELERTDEALDIAQKISQNNPDNTDMNFVLAQIYVKIGDLESAQYEFQKILAENPEDVEVLQQITQTYFDSKDWVMSEEYARRLIDINEEDLYALEVLWKSLYNQGNLEEAEKYRKIAKTLR